MRNVNVNLKEELAIYELKKETCGEFKPKITNTETELNVGDFVEFYPSIDGLPLLFIVVDYYPETDEVFLVPVTEFYQFHTETDVLFEHDGKIYMAQPKLWLNIYGKRTKLATVKYGNLPKELIENLKRKMEERTTKLEIPEIAKFKEYEKQRYTQFWFFHINSIIPK